MTKNEARIIEARNLSVMNGRSLRSDWMTIYCMVYMIENDDVPNDVDELRRMYNRWVATWED